ncbi:MAG: ethanolamine utilization protein EutH [Clostridia bacterium]|nr:ethanolamine utilization protein EutH [Clostridia bacterium]
MNAIKYTMLFFAILGAVDRIIGNRFGLGKEFEKGFMMLGNMALSMIGMIVLSPWLAEILKPVFAFFSDTLQIDPSIIPASLFANDMGGAPLAKAVALNTDIGLFNALIVSSMMGCTVSFTIPYGLGLVSPSQHREMLLGLLCGIVTIPLGCFFAGLLLYIPLSALLINLLPLIAFSLLISIGLMLKPEVCVKIFNIFGLFIKGLITVGLILGVIRYLTGFELIKGLETLEEGASVCLNAAAVICGAFPLMYIVSGLLKKPVKKFAALLHVNEISVVGLISSSATSMTTFGFMDQMDKKGVLLNCAFAVSGAFTFAGHLAFTMAFNASYLPAMILGKLSAGILAVFLANLLSNRLLKQPEGMKANDHYQ